MTLAVGAAESGRRAITVSLPLEFTAFCELRQHHYVRYAQFRTGDHDLAHRLVQCALGDLAVHWPEALGSSNPAAFAWSIVKHHVTECTPPGPGSPLVMATSDESLLRNQLQLTDDQVSQVTGAVYGIPGHRRPRLAQQPRVHAG